MALHFRGGPVINEEECDTLSKEFDGSTPTALDVQGKTTPATPTRKETHDPVHSIVRVVPCLRDRYSALKLLRGSSANAGAVTAPRMRSLGHALVIGGLLYVSGVYYLRTLVSIPYPDWFKDNLPGLLNDLSVAIVCFAGSFIYASFVGSHPETTEGKRDEAGRRQRSRFACLACCSDCCCCCGACAGMVRALLCSAFGLLRRLTRRSERYLAVPTQPHRPHPVAAGSAAEERPKTGQRWLVPLTVIVNLCFLCYMGWLDHGATLQHHGSYNLVLFVLSVLPLCGTVLAVRSAVRTCGLAKFVLIIGTLVVLVLSSGFGRLVYLRLQWRQGLGPLRLAKATPAGQPFCQWPYEQIRLPLLDILPVGGMNFWTGKWWACPAIPLAGDADGAAEESRHTGAVARPIFSASAKLMWPHAKMDAEAEKTESSCAAQALNATQSPWEAPVPTHAYVPVRLEVQCPLKYDLALTILPDTRFMPKDTKATPHILQDAVLENSRRFLISSSARTTAKASSTEPTSALPFSVLLPVGAPPSTLPHAGLLYLDIPANLFGEAFRVECGKLPNVDRPEGTTAKMTGYQASQPSDPSREIYDQVLIINRPRMDVLARLNSRWGSRKERIASSSNTSLPPNVIYIMFDAVSRLHMRRKMPRTIRFLDRLKENGRIPAHSSKPTTHDSRNLHAPTAQNKAHRLTSETKSIVSDFSNKSDSIHNVRYLGGQPSSPPIGTIKGPRVYDYLRYHAIDWTTHMITMPSWTGSTFAQPGNEPLWEYFSREAGYVSAYVGGMCEDWPSQYARYTSSADYESTAQNCLPSVYPTDTDPLGVFGGPYSLMRRCLDTTTFLHNRNLEYALSFWDAHVGFPRFLHMTFLEGHEGSAEIIGLNDDGFVLFLEQIMTKRSADRDTIVVIAPDHGLHMGISFVWTLQGRMEHMAPALHISIPEGIPCPAAPSPHETSSFFSETDVASMENNQQALVTGWEIFSTLRSVGKRANLCFPAKGEDAVKCAFKDRRQETERIHALSIADAGMSLFDGIGPERTCTDAKIDQNLCQCRHESAQAQQIRPGQAS